jgi:hypothetical protein
MGVDEVLLLVFYFIYFGYMNVFLMQEDFQGKFIYFLFNLEKSFL